MRRFYLANGPDATKLTNVKAWGNVAWTSMWSAFYGCNNLQISASDLPNLAAVTDMTSMFRGCTALNTPSNINSWNTSNITTMELLFDNATSFNQDLNSWNTANVTNMTIMFNGATSFNQDLGSWTLNPAVVMTRMLNNCGMDCGNYSATLIGWHDNNPSVTGRNLGAIGRIYNESVANNERQILTVNRSWVIGGDEVSNPQATLVPDNSTLSAHYTCEHFVNFSNNNQKLITVNPNGNSVDLDNVNISITSAFVQSLPNDVSTSNNGGGYYEINDGADLIRVSKRMTSIYAPGNYPVNGGVLVRVYFSPNDLSNIQSDPVANGLNELSHVGWFKASEHNPQNINLQCSGAKLRFSNLLPFTSNRLKRRPRNLWSNQQQLFDGKQLDVNLSKPNKRKLHGLHPNQ